MASTHTRTAAKTTTRTRVAELKVQFGITLRRATDMSPAAIKKLVGGLDEGWIAAVRIFGVEPEGKARACFVLKVDWEEHANELLSGRGYVTLDEGVLVDGALPEVHYPLDFFLEYVTAHNLRRRPIISLTDEVTANKPLLARVRNELGLGPAKVPAWAAGAQERWKTPAEIRELTIGYMFIP